MIESTKNDSSWEILFEKHRILESIEKVGFFEISATQINEEREARLMTKFDHKVNLPQIFRRYGLSILPITRGSYIISDLNTYKNFEEKEGNVVRATFPEYLESIDYENITSEATAINCAFISGILADFLEDESILPTVSGRMSSGSFDFNISNSKQGYFNIAVSNSQVEIDGGYEGIKYLSIIEAKNFISDDFLVRQLYYPYRLWSNIIKKKVNPIFLIYANGVFNLYQYEFLDSYLYNSLVLVKRKNYCIESIDITLEDIITISKRINFIKEPEVPFPQADKFRRVANLCELLSENDMTREEITTNYAFDPRQTNYYTDAGRYLGLIDKRRENGEIVYFLTGEGHRIIHSKIKTRQLRFVEAILKHRVFHETLNLYLKKLEIPDRNEIIDIMKKSDLFNVVEESTFKRRASTIAGWINWIFELQS